MRAAFNKRFGSATFTDVDPYFAYVTALLHMDGPNGSTSFIDRKGHVFTAAGNAQIDTGDPSSGSALFDGTGDFIYTPSSSDFNLSSGSFAVECFFKADVNTSFRGLVSRRGSTGTNGWVLWMRDTGKLGFVFGNGTGSWVDLIGTTTITTGVWHHGAATFDGTTARLFLDGALEASTASFSGGRQTASVQMLVGRSADTITTRDWDGRIRGVRVTKGAPRYTSAFTSPTLPLPSA